jgi:hypothetical protein
MESVFSANPDINELLVFEDGNCFKLKDRNLADHHKAMTGLSYTMVVRGEKKEAKEEPKEEIKEAAIAEEEKTIKTKTKKK